MTQQFIYRTIKGLAEVTASFEQQFPKATILKQPLKPNEVPLNFSIFVHGNLILESEIPDYLDKHGIDHKIKRLFIFCV